MHRLTMRPFSNGSLFLLLLLAAILTMPSASVAGDAKGYVAPPDGTAGILIYARHRTGNEAYRNGQRTTQDADFDMNLQIFRPVYYKEIKGVMTSVQALVPFGNITLNGTSASGLMDPTVLFGIWPVNDPDNKLWVAFSQWFQAPLGDYDAARTLNLGKNRWAFKTEASLTKGFGNFYFDIVPSIEFYTDNDNFGALGQTEKTDPLFRLETHYSYDFTPSFMLSLGHYYEKGGETEVGGINQKNEKDNHALQLTLGFRPAPKQQILVQYWRDVDVESGILGHQFGLRYFFVF
ncbi:transporter [Desulfobotulus sp. H1]|uniref:Transporter n=1 Tax=Desulfobotulus pelophilus TaxID=2823377 RepID=A0ABT3N744_9BACT|nr:transporter [Desulfobotulus pelophilus]MCW7753273.1 transporter [Desulfobotulus pelophilus]